MEGETYHAIKDIRQAVVEFCIGDLSHFDAAVKALSEEDEEGEEQQQKKKETKDKKEKKTKDKKQDGPLTTEQTKGSIDEIKRLFEAHVTKETLNVLWPAVRTSSLYSLTVSDLAHALCTP